KSNAWLINVNMLALLITLYACSAANLGGLIADYNVRHCREVTGQGNPLDVAYLEEIGPSALPALLWLEENFPNNKLAIFTLEDRLQLDASKRQSDWRDWTFQNYRLLQS